VSGLNAATNSLQIQATANTTGKVDKTDARYLAALTNNPGWLTNVVGYVATNDPALTNARDPVAHNQGYTTITDAPWLATLPLTNALVAATNALNIRVTALDAPTQSIGWAEGFVTNLLLSCTNADPNIVGIYTQVADVDGFSRWHNDNGYYVWTDTSGTWNYIGTNGSGALPAGATWYHDGVLPYGDYSVYAVSATGTIHAVVQETWNVNTVKADVVALQGATNAINTVANAALSATNRVVLDAPGSAVTNLLVWVGSTNDQTSTNAGTLYFTW
jgi:hypothetical protein